MVQESKGTFESVVSMENTEGGSGLNPDSLDAVLNAYKNVDKGDPNDPDADISDEFFAIPDTSTEVSQPEKPVTHLRSSVSTPPKADRKVGDGSFHDIFRDDDDLNEGE